MTPKGGPTSTKPYLLRAVYEWCVDNGHTPQISVAVDARTRVPKEHVRDGKIVLNIGPKATSGLKMGNDLIECTARFSSVARELVVPVAAVTAIFARETGQGMMFEPEGTAGGDDATATPDSKASPKAGGRPALKRIK